MQMCCSLLLLNYQYAFSPLPDDNVQMPADPVVGASMDITVSSGEDMSPPIPVQEGICIHVLGLNFYTGGGGYGASDCQKKSIPRQVGTYRYGLWLHEHLCRCFAFLFFVATAALFPFSLFLSAQNVFWLDIYLGHLNFLVICLGCLSFQCLSGFPALYCH